jgi:hypothetical protein
VLHGADFDLKTWCIDIFHDLAGSGTFTISSAPSSNGTIPPPNALDGTTIGETGALAAWGNAHIGDSYDVSSGTQIAIWRTEYEDGGYTFTGSAGAKAMADSLLAMTLSPVPNRVELVGGLAGLASARRRRRQGRTSPATASRA